MESYCRSNNTAGIHMNEMSWAGSFDSYEIYFGHTKTDQIGDDAKYPRHLYANPHEPLSCPVFALSLYFTCCFNQAQDSNSLLFPGTDQAKRFADILARCLEENEAAVNLMGYGIKDIGTHSVRKGAISHLALMPGGRRWRQFASVRGGRWGR